MKPTHTDYMHPRHLRVEDGHMHPAWNIGAGHYTKTSVCISPSCSDYAMLNKSNLPKWRGDKIVDGVAIPLTEAEWISIKEPNP